MTRAKLETEWNEKMLNAYNFIACEQFAAWRLEFQFLIEFIRSLGRHILRNYGPYILMVNN